MELQDRLSRQGFSVCGSAHRGEEALERIPAARPDLVILDVNLGDGIDGIEASRQLREQIDIPVIFLTAYSDEGTMERAVSAEAACYLTKPFDERVLGANIKLAIHRHAVQRECRDAIHQQVTQMEAAKRQLREVLSDVKQLTGPLPVCSGCKRIRDGQGSWHDLESFLSKPTNARLLQELCPTCFQGQKTNPYEDSEQE